ncbi:MAG: sensor histidine kinase [Selenomonadaceae bacterium]|nr:sensor histidine kinase [Selenomonadaceae bacterium]
MTEDVFNSINELKKIFAESRNARLFTVIPENFDAEVINAAKSDRDKMIEVLNRFYKEHCQKAEGVDDFVTLFGVYCNYYILYGLHLILKEDDFGTNKIFENIGNASLKEYLSLIREGIRTQEPVHFEEAVKKNKDYSLAHFYLFLRCLRKYWSRSDYAEHEEELLKHYKAIRNDELRNYAVGRSELFPHINNYMIELMKTQLAGMLARFFNSEQLSEFMKTGDKIFDAPPLPCPYLMTNEELERMFCFFIAYLSCSFLGEIYYFFWVGICCSKEFSEALSFIASKLGIWSDEEEARSGLFEFFKKSGTDEAVAMLISDILFCLPLYLEETKNLLQDLNKEDFDIPHGENFLDSTKQLYQELEKDYLAEQPSLSKAYDIFEKAESTAEGINNQCMVWRSFFLEIPYVIKWTNRELYNLMERISIQHEKDTMVRDYMHTYSNMKADALYDIAQLLLKRDNPEDKRNGRELLLEYALKKELSNSVYMMQLMYKNSVEDLKKMINKSLVSAEDDHESISDILNKSLLQCFINIFYGNQSDKTDKMAENLKKVWGKTFLEDKREQFEQQFMEADFDCLAWLSREGINFTCEQEPVWEKVFLERESFGSTFLKIIFDELCVNVFKYGDLKKEIRLRLSQNENNDLVISFENHFTRSRVASGTQIGVGLLRRRIQILREDAKKNCVEVVDDKLNRIFRIRLLLPAALFLNQSSVH